MDVKATFQALTEMQTTKDIADEVDKLLETIGNANGSIELVALVVLAQLTSGKGQINMLNTQ